MTKAKESLQQPRRSDGFLEPPAYHKTTYEVIRSLKKALDAVERAPGCELGQKEFGRLIGAPRSTIHDWYHGKLASPIEHFLCAMERLSEAQRTALLRDLCRDYPRLTHPRLAHDPQVIAWLRGLLIEPFVLGFVTGPTDALRTFLITAIGNSIPLIVPRKRICGLDVHRPDSFVPVPGVLYFRNPSDSAQVKRIILTQWNEIENSSADVFLFNGVWALLPEIRDNILRLAKRHIVMVADKFDSSFPGQGAARDVVVNRVCGDFRPNHQIGIRIEKGAAA